jgi:hypothetical protein
MLRVTAAALALGCAVTLTASAQDTTVKTTTKSSGGDAKTMTYTGCVGAGTETRSFRLDKVVPISKTTESVGTAGTTTTTETSYVLVPGERVEIQRHVGHKVEVTGTLIPAGDVKTETTTKIEREGAKDTTIKEKSKAENAMAQFHVASIKDLAESCEP